MTKLKEIWKDVIGYKGTYQVSNLGRVKSLEKTYIHNVHKHPSIRKEKLLKQGYSHKLNGYPVVSLTKSAYKAKTYKVHRLVAMAFIPNPNKRKTVNHKNGIKTDNTVENLEWATYSENFCHALSNGLIKIKKGYDDYRSKQVLQLSKKGILIREWANASATPYIPSNIRNCCNGKRKSASGFMWKFKNQTI